MGYGIKHLDIDAVCLLPPSSYRIFFPRFSSRFSGEKIIKSYRYISLYNRNIIKYLYNFNFFNKLYLILFYTKYKGFFFFYIFVKYILITPE